MKKLILLGIVFLLCISFASAISNYTVSECFTDINEYIFYDNLSDYDTVDNWAEIGAPTVLSVDNWLKGSWGADKTITTDGKVTFSASQNWTVRLDFEDRIAVDYNKIFTFQVLGTVVGFLIEDVINGDYSYMKCDNSFVSAGSRVAGNHTLITRMFGDSMEIYLDGNLLVNDTTCSNEAAPTSVRMGGYSGTSSTHATYTKDWMVWNGTGDCPGFAAPPSSSTLNLSSPLPPNESSFNVLTVNFNLTANSTTDFNCSIYINNTLNTTTLNHELGVNRFVDFNVTFSEDGEYRYIIGCTNFDNDTNTSEITFFMDFEVPTVVTDFFNNSFFSTLDSIDNNLTAQFNLTDNILLHSFNISIDDKLIFSTTNIHATTFQYNLSWNVSNLSLGKHIINILVADGHTSFRLENDYDWSNGLWNDYLRYDFPEGGFIKTESKGKSIFDSWDTERKIDRYTQTFWPSEPSSTQTFIEESDLPIHIVNKPGHYKDYWIIVGNHWKDYVLKDEPDSKVSIKRINPYKVEVTVSEIKNNLEKLEFESIGDLNTIDRSWDFYVVNLTSNFEDFILADFAFGINLSMDFGLLEFDISGLTPNVTLEINDTNFTATQITFNNTTGLFRKTFSVAESLFDGNIFHKWYFDLGNYTPELLETGSENQTAIDIEINQCGTTANYTILNITYFDEVTDGIINASNAYQLKIYDGTYYYNQTDSFIRNTTNQLCTNLPPSLLTYNWDLWGAFTLSEPAYITRIVDIDVAVPIAISNDPQTELSLFLIKTANSSTVTYNWFTSNFQLVTGTMRIYQCNPDGSQSLVESTPVIAGVATANIELLTQPYAYDVVIGGQVFSNTDDYSRCHVESATEVTFFVETEIIDIGPLIGLGAIPCTITKVTNTTVNMTWTANSEQTGYVEGCVIVNRRTITGNVEVLENCSVEAEGYSRIVTIPIVEGNTYIVSGELNQNGRTVICSGQTMFSPSDEAGGLFSFTGLLAAFFLVLALILMYSGEGESQLTGAGIGIVAAWILGILNWGWIVTSSIIFFLIIIALIGRHSRVSTPV